MSDTANFIAEGLAQLAGGEYKSDRYYELISPDKQKRPKKDNRTGEQIIADTIRLGGLEMVHNGSI